MYSLCIGGTEPGGKCCVGQLAMTRFAEVARFAKFRPVASHRRVGALPPYRTSAPCVAVVRKGEGDCGIRIPGDKPSKVPSDMVRA